MSYKILTRVVNLKNISAVNLKNIKCQNCKYYRKIDTLYERTELCTLFMFGSTPQEPEIKYIEANYCRNHESLCGPSAKHFKSR